MDEEFVEESQHQTSKENCNYSPETLLSVAGNLEFVVGKVTALSSRLRDATFIDIDAMLNEIIFSCECISAAVEKVEETAQEYLKERCSKSDYTEDYLGNRIYRNIEHDPGKRPATLSDADRNYLIHLGPCQPKLNIFPKNAEVKKSSQCRFSASWYNEYPYLEYSISKDSAHCFVCSLFPTAIDRQKADDAWITGIRNWHKMKGSQGKGKPGKLSQHFSSKSHKASLEDFVHFCQQDHHINLLWDKEARAQLIEQEKQVQEQREVISILLDIARTLCRQGLAFRGHESEAEGNFCQLVELMSRYVPSLRGWIESRAGRKYKTTYMSSDSQNEFIKLLADECKLLIDKELDAASFTAVIADTTPDVSNDDQLTVAVRYVNEKGTPCERLLETKKVHDKSGAGLAKAILDAAQERKIKTDTIRFQTYDSASAMSGRYKGAQQVLSELLERPIIYTACLPHGSNLAIEHGSNASRIVSYMYDTLEALYVFFSASTKRHFHLSEILKNAENRLQLTNLSKTRWSARPEAIKAVWASYEEICCSLQEISSDENFDKESRNKAFGLLTKIKSFDFIFTIMFIKNVMYKMKMMIDILQTEELDVSGALLVMLETKESLERIRKDENAIDNEVQAACLFAKQFDVDAESEFRRIHRRRVPPKRLDAAPETGASLTMAGFYRKEVFAFLDTMISVLSSKITSLEASFRPLIDVLDPNATPSTEKVRKLAAVFPNDIPDPDALAAEIEVFLSYCDKEKAKKEEPLEPFTIRDAANLAIECHRKHKLFSNVAKIYRLFLTSPPSVCKSERSFSRLKLLKNYLRSTMSQERLDNLMLLYCERDILDTINIERAVDNWANVRCRRISIA